MSIFNVSRAIATLQRAYDKGSGIILNLVGVSIKDNSTPISGNLLEVTDNGDTVEYLAVDSTGIRSTQADIDNIQINSNSITATDTNGDINLVPDGTGSVIINDLSIKDNVITVDTTNTDLELAPNGTGDVLIDSKRLRVQSNLNSIEFGASSGDFATDYTLTGVSGKLFTMDSLFFQGATGYGYYASAKDPGPQTNLVPGTPIVWKDTIYQEDTTGAVQISSPDLTLTEDGFYFIMAKIVIDTPSGTLDVINFQSQNLGTLIETVGYGRNERTITIMTLHTVTGGSDKIKVIDSTAIGSTYLLDDGYTNLYCRYLGLTK